MPRMTRQERDVRERLEKFGYGLRRHSNKECSLFPLRDEVDSFHSDCDFADLDSVEWYLRHEIEDEGKNTLKLALLEPGTLH